jgi:putative oxidoreductase
MTPDLSILILRTIVGLLFIGHGLQKLVPGFGGPGPTGMAGWLSSMGMRPAKFWALMAGLSEAGGGLLLALGLLNPLGALGITAAMLIAIKTVHWGRLWAADNGMELPLVYLAVVTTAALTGPGTYSLDAAFGVHLPMPAAYLAGLGLVIVGVGAALGSAHRSPAIRENVVESDAAPRAA